MYAQECLLSHKSYVIHVLQQTSNTNKLNYQYLNQTTTKKILFKIRITVTSTTKTHLYKRENVLFGNVSKAHFLYPFILVLVTPFSQVKFVSLP